MNVLYRCSVFLLLGMTSSCLIVRADALSTVDTPNCGIQSVLDFARFLDKAPKEEQAIALCKTYPQAEISMFDVQQAAKQVGVQLDGVKASVAELEKRHQPFIAVLPDHFVFVERVEGEWVRHSENEGFSIEPRAQFEADYQGKALVLSPAEKVNALRVSPSIVVWDRVLFGVPEKTATINLINTSNEPIEIGNITTSCSCTVLSQWPRQLLPHQSVPLRITMRMPFSGEFSQSVTIFSKLGRPYQMISLFGRVETDISLDPAQVGFGEVALGSTATRTLIVRDVDHKLPRPLQVATTDKKMTARLTPQTQDSWEVVVFLSPSVPLGEVDAGLLISGQEKGSRVVRVPIHGRVVPMTRARPEQVVFGSIFPGGATRRLQIFRQDRQPFEVVSVEAPPYLKCEVGAPNQRHTEWSAHVLIDPAKAPAQVSDKIVVKTKRGDQEEDISIPVFALNEGNTAPSLPGAARAALLPRAEADPETRIGLPLPTLKVSEVAPDFRVVDANGNPWHLSALRGQKNVLLTFFPKCFTGGCATQLSSLRDHQSDFDAAQTQILAVSVDPAEGDKGQLAFAKQWGFQFPLIPDTKRVMGKQFGAIQNDDERAARLSFLIDKQGIVRWINTDVHVESHGADVLARIKELGLDK